MKANDPKPKLTALLKHTVLTPYWHSTAMCCSLLAAPWPHNKHNAPDQVQLLCFGFTHPLHGCCSLCAAVLYCTALHYSCAVHYGPVQVRKTHARQSVTHPLHRCCCHPLTHPHCCPHSTHSPHHTPHSLCHCQLPTAPTNSAAPAPPLLLAAAGMLC